MSYSVAQMVSSISWSSRGVGIRDICDISGDIWKAPVFLISKPAQGLLTLLVALV